MAGGVEAREGGGLGREKLFFFSRLPFFLSLAFSPFSRSRFFFLRFLFFFFSFFTPRRPRHRRPRRPRFRRS